MNASFLLQPSATPRRESWKGIALTLMVLCGLSTSALALTLYSGVDRSEPAAELQQLVLSASSVDAPEEVPLGRVLASEPPIYSVTTAPGLAVPAPETRETKAPVATKKKPKQVSTSARTSNAAADSCDEVACLIDGSDACCLQYESVRADEPVESEERYRPYRLTRNEITEPMQSIRSRVVACSNTHGFAGVASIKVVVSPQGSISSFALDDGSSSFQSCVEEQVKTLSFPELLQPFSFTFPYSL